MKKGKKVSEETKSVHFQGGGKSCIRAKTETRFGSVWVTRGVTSVDCLFSWIIEQAIF